MKTTAWYVYGNIEYRVALHEDTLTHTEAIPYVKPKKRKHHLRPANRFNPTNINIQNG